MLSPESATLKNLFDRVSSIEDADRRKVAFRSSRRSVSSRVISDFRRPKRQSVSSTKIQPRVVDSKDSSGPIIATELVQPVAPIPQVNAPRKGINQASGISRRLAKTAILGAVAQRRSTPKLTSAVKKAEKQISVNKKNRIKQSVIWLLIVATFLVGSYVIWTSLVASKAINNVTNNGSGGQSSSSVSPDSPASRDESQPDTDGYRVAPDMPRLITIESLGVRARVLSVGIDDQNRMGTPNNIFDTGWYDGSVKPGSGSGAAVIDGHRTGSTKTGVFERLDQLNKGDVVSIERGDGKIINYSVETKESVPYEKVDMLKALTPIKPGKEGLTLISCSGEWDQQAKTNLTREVVYAVRI